MKTFFFMFSGGFDGRAPAVLVGHALLGSAAAAAQASRVHMAEPARGKPSPGG
jgi:hypothetical protein